jgi:hypothetical protein
MSFDPEELKVVACWGKSIEPQSGYVWLLECSYDLKDLRPELRGSGIAKIGIFLSSGCAVRWLETHHFERLDSYVWKEQKGERPRYVVVTLLPLYSNFGTEHEKIETMRKLADIFQT